MRKFIYLFNIIFLHQYSDNKLKKKPYMRQLLLQITAWEVKGARNGKTVHDWGPGNELETCVLRETDPYDHTK